MKQIVTWILLSLAFFASSQKVVQSHSATKRDTDISHLEAVRIANQFTAAISMPEGNWQSGKAMLRSMREDGSRRRWVLGCGIYMISVDSEARRVKSFNYLKRQNDQFHRRGRTGQIRYTTDLAAKNRLREVARQCGLPSDIVLDGFSNKRDGTVKDANTCGYIGAIFYRNGKRVARIMCDVQDGVPISIVLD